MDYLVFLVIVNKDGSRHVQGFPVDGPKSGADIPAQVTAAAVASARIQQLTVDETVTACVTATYEAEDPDPNMMS